MESTSPALTDPRGGQANGRAGLYLIRTFLVVAVLLGVIQAGLLFGPARVAVESNAPDSYFYLDGRLVKQKSTWTLPPYEKSIQIHASGYWPQATRVKLRPFRTTTVSISLEKSEGLLSITGFEEGTVIIIDGSLEYTCPIQNIRLPVGQHVLRVPSSPDGPLVCGVTLSADIPLTVPATEFSVDGR